jgi:23S rRNA G2069 N7-methylase RlmK/C1962 C5-methylase RlmI
MSEESPDENLRTYRRLKIEQARLRLAILENDDTLHLVTSPYWERLNAARQNLQQLLKQKDNQWRLIDR